MNPISYVKILRLWLVGGMIVSGIGLGAMLLFVDPTISLLNIFGFLTVMMVFATSIISLGGLWWFFDENRRLLTLNQINSIIYQSLFTSSIVILLLVMSQTNILNLFTTLLVAGVYVLYQLWAQSQS
jgi:high-affinity Fe2+/Pb2+ permease